MKRSSKIVIGTVVTLGLVGVVTAKQFDGPGCGMGPGGMSGALVSQKMAWKLNLNDAQRAELDQLRKQVFANMNQMRQQRPSSDEIQAVMGEKLDQDKALKILDERLQRARDKAPEMIAAFGEFYDSLDAEQKAELGEMIERRIEQGLHHRGGKRGKGDYRDGPRGGKSAWDYQQ